MQLHSNEATKAIQLRDHFLGMLKDHTGKVAITYNKRGADNSVESRLVTVMEGDNKRDALETVIKILTCIIKSFVHGNEKDGYQFKMPKIWQYPSALACLFIICKELIRLIWTLVRPTGKKEYREIFDEQQVENKFMMQLTALAKDYNDLNYDNDDVEQAFIDGGCKAKDILENPLIETV
jgi:hypothetical protein